MTKVKAGRHTSKTVLRTQATPLTITVSPQGEVSFRPATAYEQRKQEHLKGRPLPKRTGAEVVAYLQKEGLIGSYGDPNLDSPELARKLREEANRCTDAT